jgi:hypothetical protein
VRRGVIWMTTAHEQQMPSLGVVVVGGGGTRCEREYDANAWGATRLAALGSRLTLDRHARLFCPSMFMAHEPQMPSLGGGKRWWVVEEGGTRCEEGCCVDVHGTWNCRWPLWGWVGWG